MRGGIKKIIACSCECVCIVCICEFYSRGPEGKLWSNSNFVLDVLMRIIRLGRHLWQTREKTVTNEKKNK